MADGPIIEARELVKRYGRGKGIRTAVDSVSLDVFAGEWLAIVGPSGCGKSTLLGMLGCLDRSHEGRLMLFGQHTEAMKDSALAALRSARIGFVFQAFHLLGHLSARDNVTAPALFARQGMTRAQSEQRAEQLLAEVGLEGRGGDRPEQLSGGERQRVAIARALFMEPELLLCDEPTGNLDERTGAQITELFGRLHKDHGLTVVTVTHEPMLASAASRVLRMHAGKLVEDGDDASSDGQGAAA